MYRYLDREIDRCIHRERNRWIEGKRRNLGDRVCHSAAMIGKQTTYIQNQIISSRTTKKNPKNGIREPKIILL